MISHSVCRAIGLGRVARVLNVGMNGAAALVQIVWGSIVLGAASISVMVVLSLISVAAGRQCVMIAGGSILVVMDSS